ncbi:MAG: hypothetical protein AAF598_18010, partial [Bacteroidota bacterium]
MKIKAFVLLSIVLMSQSAFAQLRRNTTEASQNKKAMAANEAQLERDVQELAAFKTKLSIFENAFAEKNEPQVKALKADLTNMMQREISQSEQKIAQDKQEVAQSKQEVASSNREVGRSRVDRATPDNDRKDTRDLRDDSRDLAEEQRDAVDDKNYLEQQ